MEESLRHLAVVIGASEIAESLRRTLVHRGINHAGITTHMRGLRRSLVLGENDVVVLCIALDQANLAQHGEAIKTLIADQHCFPHEFRSVGLLDGIGLSGAAAELGCDLYVHGSRQALLAMHLLARHARLSPRMHGRFAHSGSTEFAASEMCSVPGLEINRLRALVGDPRTIRRRAEARSEANLRIERLPLRPGAPDTPPSPADGSE